MRYAASIAAALLVATPALVAANPFADMKLKPTVGEWEYRMKMGAIPGMPAGMTLPEQVFKHCVTAKDVDTGSWSQKDGKMPEGCSIKNMKTLPNGASWTMECTKDPKMVADVVMTGTSSAYTMKQNITMDQGGQKMKMDNTMTAKYLGACTAEKK